ncbi:MAG: 6,7-dimethyl-8-ribityllumazine synthase [Nitrospina sp.]|jgi:6,7-dimethyl-8-ribityllumazine synthase|nr:6,7-dimethyl-8-ribityllumazine synthase [Nitrospina sp.]MBT3508100.1 6,7-dimethyl-8-ribityllumazine synthase [Nitrospina sp.]MBT3876318.1 6,7-dimethyl-8-ribityllumazine synthase [Nitrospina sp.]MBT4049966.1 6,7-dimethyl-8-ribityllumazine synthase [Nitrospina sp.]MBT4556634.1 6,7-dimethyl-8-ribityllumazine synthase [Nitrospina sp.]
MVKYIEGDHNAKGLRVGIVVSRFNDLVTSKLLSGALSALKENGANEENLEVVRVPGAFEIPQAAKKLCSSRELDAVVCLGAVIKGGTPHFDYICAETSRGVGQVGLEFNIPVLFGVLTTNDLEQAIARTGSSNKGRETALAAIEMVNLFRKI